MNVRTVTRQAIDGYLSVVKFPVDLVARRVGPVLSGRTDAQLIVDRVDAEIRDLVGRLLLDDELREDAARRRAAASAAAHIGRLHVRSDGLGAGSVPVAGHPADPRNDLEDLRRRDDRTMDLRIEEGSLADRAAAQLGEEEIARITDPTDSERQK